MQYTLINIERTSLRDTLTLGIAAAFLLPKATADVEATGVGAMELSLDGLDDLVGELEGEST